MKQDQTVAAQNGEKSCGVYCPVGVGIGGGHASERDGWHQQKRILLGMCLPEKMIKQPFLL